MESMFLYAYYSPVPDYSQSIEEICVIFETIGKSVSITNDPGIPSDDVDQFYIKTESKSKHFNFAVRPFNLEKISIQFLINSEQFYRLDDGIKHTLDYNTEFYIVNVICKFIRIANVPVLSMTLQKETFNFPIKQNKIEFGRLDNEKLSTYAVSRKHISISIEGNKIEITDLHSAYGTFVKKNNWAFKEKAQIRVADEFFILLSTIQLKKFNASFYKNKIPGSNTSLEYKPKEEIPADKNSFTPSPIKSKISEKGSINKFDDKSSIDIPLVMPIITTTMLDNNSCLKVDKASPKFIQTTGFTKNVQTPVKNAQDSSDFDIPITANVDISSNDMSKQSSPKFQEGHKGFPSQNLITEQESPVGFMNMEHKDVKAKESIKAFNASPENLQMSMENTKKVANSAIMPNIDKIVQYLQGIKEINPLLPICNEMLKIKIL